MPASKIECGSLASPITKKATAIDESMNYRQPLRCRNDKDIFASRSHLDLFKACASDLSHSSGTRAMVQGSARSSIKTEGQLTPQLNVCFDGQPPWAGRDKLTIHGRSAGM
jgi:hypothetical protein